MAKRPGAHTLNRLTALAITRQKVPGRYADGGGLYLQVAPTGAKSWVFRFMIAGRAREMGIGPVADVAVDDARKQALAARALVRQGVDPLDARTAARAAERDRVGAVAANEGRTFEWCAETYVDTVKRPELTNPKHAAQWVSTLKAYAYPKLGPKVVGHITLGDVHEVLSEIWLSKNETASRVRQRIESVMDWAKVKGFRTGDNPAKWKGGLDHLLAKPSKVKRDEHFPSLPYLRVAEFMAALRTHHGASPAALQFLILTAQRTNPVILAEWAEIDWERKVWESPPAKMKGVYPHRVPLSPAALAVLKERQAAQHGTYIFHTGGKALSNAAMLVLVSKMHTDATPWVDPKQGGRRIVPHGFRSSFRDWAADAGDAPHEVCEMCLAHSETSKTVAAYLRTDMLERRRPLMVEWARFCGG